jgi:hypothetical protein
VTIIPDVVVVSVFEMACSVRKYIAVVFRINGSSASPQVKSKHRNTKGLAINVVVYGKNS